MKLILQAGKNILINKGQKDTTDLSIIQKLSNQISNSISIIKILKKYILANKEQQVNQNRFLPQIYSLKSFAKDCFPFMVKIHELKILIYYYTDSFIVNFINNCNFLF